ncbi:MAG: tripartite tricarboxylate transporter TctB family protein [Patescibacteria group bacterium]
MRFTIAGRRVEVEYPAILIGVLIFGWGLYYYFSTAGNPKGGAESVLFIKPLSIALAISFVFVILDAIKVEPTNGGIQVTAPEAAKDSGFLDKRRITLAGSLVFYGFGLNYLGFFIPSVLFLSFLFYCFGVRNLWVLLGLASAFPVLLVFVFKILMKLPIPAWPF